MLHHINTAFPAHVSIPSSGTRYSPLAVTITGLDAARVAAPGGEVYVRARDCISGAVVSSVLTTRAGVALSASGAAFAPAGSGWLAVPVDASLLFPFALAVASTESHTELDIDVLVGTSVWTRMVTKTIRLESLSMIIDNQPIKTTISGPLGAFGELITAGLSPRVQFDATYGVLTTDVVTSTANSGTATNAASVFSCATSTNSAGVSQLFSRRALRYRPGEGCRIRITAAFTAGVANSNQFCGGYNISEALGFYYSGTSFGILRRIAGTQQIITLTITAAAGGAENFTVRLSGVNYTITSGGALATTALTAQRIADQWPSAIGTTVWSCRSVGSTVIFVQSYCAVSGGTNTFTSSGTATGTMAVTQAGAANDDTTGFTAQTSWTEDVMDGTGSASNPSGILLANTGTPSNTLIRRDYLNVYEIIFPYLGVGTMQFRIMGPDGTWHTVHKIKYPGTAVTPTMRNPTLRLGWWAVNSGNNTNIVVKGICAAGFVEGEILPPRDPTGCENPNFSAGTTEYAALCIRVGATFASQVNRRQANQIRIVCGTDSSNRVMSVRAILNPTAVSGDLNWQYINSARSSIEYAIPAANATITGGDPVGYTSVSSGNSSVLDLDYNDVRLQAGDLLVVGVKTLTGTATMNVTAVLSEN